jgi:hypothetical protein
MIERTFTVAGTTKDPKTEMVKVRWGNDMISRFKVLDSSGKEDINLHELPEPMTKLDSLKWLLKHTTLNEAEEEAVFLKKAEKSRAHQKATVKVAMQQDVQTLIKQQ